MSIKLVAFDLDGTLLNNQAVVPEKNKLALKQLREKGVKITIASGRPPYSIYPIAKSVNLEDYFISLDGCLIKKLDGEILLKKPLNKQVVFEILTQAEEMHCSPLLFRASPPYLLKFANLKNEFQTDFLSREKSMFSMTEGDIQETDNIKVSLELETLAIWISGQANFIEELAQKISLKRYEDILVRVIPLNPAYYDKYTADYKFLFINQKNVNKFSGIKYLINHYGMGKEGVAAFGDWLNDREMLDNVGYPVLMGNAPAEMHNDRYLLTKTNEENGVYEGLRKLNLIE